MSMQKSSLPVAVKTLKRYYETDSTLNLRPSIQRKSGLWSPLQRSLLIDSMLRDYLIPNLYLQKESIDGVSHLSVLDGLQRLSTVFSFVNNEWSLSNKLDPVTIDGVEYEIAGKKFEELDSDIQSAITQYRFNTYQLENCTPDEIEETFSRLNGGLALSKIQSARSKMGIDNAEWINSLLEFEFFTKNLNLTLAAARREDDLAILLISMMLLEQDYFHCDFEIKTSASTAEAVRFAEYMRDNYTEERKDSISLLVEYLDMAFDDETKKFLKKGNSPIVIFMGYVCLDSNIDAKEFGDAVIEFFESGTTEAYEEASGSGNVRLDKVRTRIAELNSFILSKFPDLATKEVEQAVAS